MSRKPFVPIILSVIFGILLKIQFSFFLTWIFLLSFFLLILLKNRTSLIFLYLSIISFASFYLDIHSYIEHKNIANYAGRKGNLIGTVIEYPTRYPDRMYVVLKVEEFDGFSASGLISVNLPLMDVFLSDKLSIKNAKIKQPKEYKNPGRYSRKKVLQRKKIYSCTYVSKIEDVVTLGKGRVNPLLFFASRIKERAERVLSLVPEEERGFLLGILIGERRGLSYSINKAFSDTGTIHILSVSGLHIALLGIFFLGLFRLFGLKSKVSYILLVPILFTFGLVTGMQSPTARSLIIGWIVLVSLMFDREFNHYNTLAIACLILLIINPYEIYNIGFQLSFIACISLIYLTPKFMMKAEDGLIPFGFISTCISAWLGTIPTVLFWFGKVSLIAPLANFFVVPIVGILLSCGLLFILLGFIHIPLAEIFVLPLSFLTTIAIKVIFFFSSIPKASISIPSPSILVVIFLYLFILFVVCLKKKAIIPSLLIINILLWYNLFKPKDTKVYFLDVGTGDCIFIKGNSNILVDGGNTWIFHHVLFPFLRYKGINKIDIVVVTHQDSDHIGGIVGVLDEYDVGRVFFNGIYSDTKIFKEFAINCKKRGIKKEILEMGDRIELNGINIDVFGPPQKRFKKDNDNSIVLKLCFPATSILLTGDIERSGMVFLEKSFGKGLSSEILKAPHHGRVKMSQSFLSFVGPKLVIIQGGIYNDYLSTVKDGAITVKINKKGFRVKTYCGKKFS